MNRLTFFITIFVFAFILSNCTDATDPEMNTLPTGIWRANDAGAFGYLILFEDNTFLYAENDPDALSDEENGLEVGTYSYNQETGIMTAIITYDDNDPGNDSGVGDAGVPVNIGATISDDGTELNIAGGALVLQREEPDTLRPVEGVWRINNGAEFNYLALFSDDVFLYAENDFGALSEAENGLEVGTYLHDEAQDLLTFSIVYDDNDPGNDSGVGDIGQPVNIDAVLSNGDSILTIGSGLLIFERAF